MAKQKSGTDPLAGLSLTARKIYPVLVKMKLRINALPVADGRIHLSKWYVAALMSALDISQSSNFHKAIRELENAGFLLVDREKGRGHGAYVTVL